MNVIHCPHCGTTNRAGSNFCNRCGANLQSDEPGEPTASPAALPTDEGQAAGQANHALSAPDDADWSNRASDEPGEGTKPSDPLHRTTTFQPSVAWPEEEDAPAVQSSPAGATARRLITGVQGLLEPLQIASELRDLTESSLPLTRPTVEALGIDAEQLRRLRSLLTEDPVLLDLPLAAAHQPPVRLHLPWLTLLLSLAIALPILLNLTWPVGTVQQWPGVDEAHTVIDALPPGATVLVVWAYDPATAAEMDLVALPVASHLLERRLLPVIVSQLPGGLAVAQRLFKRAIDGLVADSTLSFMAQPDLYVQGGFLPGGAAVLSLLAQEPASVLVNHVPSAVTLSAAVPTRPALTIVVAAQAEDVQDWLEQGQPIQLAPVVAFTSAGADPLLRPYLGSGQLSGLVSGFDGAISYQNLRTVHLAGSEEVLLLRQVVLQNWGHFALLLLLLLGNLAAVGWGGQSG